MVISPKALSVGMSGFDTSATLTNEQIQVLASHGLKFAVRYVPLWGRADPSIKKPEFDALLEAGFGVMLVQHPRRSGWSEAVGRDDGKAGAEYALSLGFPPGACLWLDLGNAGGAQSTITYANAWYKGAVEGGMYGSGLGVYCEPGVPLTSEQLYHSLTVSRYWRTAAQFPNVAVRGSQLLQLWPGNLKEAGTLVDRDVVQSDYLGSLPIAAFSTT